MDIDLTGKHAVVCGASRGIGQACARALAGLGAAITVVARNEAALGRVVEDLDTSKKQKHQCVVADFSKPDEVSERFGEYLADRPAQILVNNSGGPPPGPIAEADDEAFVAGMRSHLLCNQRLVRAALPGMRQAGFGRIVNIISTSVYEPIPGLGVSNTVRAAVAAWAKTLAGELAPEGVTVNNVLPGFTATDRLDSLIATRAENSGRDEEEIAAGMRAQVPMGRFGEPGEIAAAVAFLASPAAAYITGISLAADGGRLKSL